MMLQFIIFNDTASCFQHECSAHAYCSYGGKANIYCAYCVALSLIAGCKADLHKVIPTARQFQSYSLDVSIAVFMIDGALNNLQRRH